MRVLKERYENKCSELISIELEVIEMFQNMVDEREIKAECFRLFPWLLTRQKLSKELIIDHEEIDREKVIIFGDNKNIEVYMLLTGEKLFPKDFYKMNEIADIIYDKFPDKKEAVTVNMLTYNDIDISDTRAFLRAYSGHKHFNHVIFEDLSEYFEEMI